MSIRRNWQPVAFLLAAATWFCMLGSVQAEQSRLATYDQADGSTFFALSISPKIDQSVLSPRSIVVLIDTSASQTGPYRSDSLTSLVALLNGLKSTDMVQIMAADLKAVPMMSKLSPARSEASRKAFGKLRARAPLGSTDMYEILSSAHKALKDTSKTARRIVYIGDGVSNAGNLNDERFEKLIGQLVSDRISVSSLAIGPKCNVELLSTIANHTGGNVIVDSDKTSAQQVGTALAKATRGVVVWPNSVTMPEGIVDSFPTAFPPLRADRDSIVVGALNRAADMKLTVDATVEGDREQFDWSLHVEPSNEDFAYLSRLVNLARKDRGIRLPTAGSEALREVRRVLVAEASNMSEIGGRALASGDIAAAKALADAALANDPTNTQADVIRDAVKRREDKSPIKFMQLDASGDDDAPLLIAPESDLEAMELPQEDGAPVPAAPVVEGQIIGSAAPVIEGTIIESAPIDAGVVLGAQFTDASFSDSMDFERDNGQFLDEVEQRRRAAEALLKVEVRNGITDARDTLGSEPDQAVSRLKLLLETVRGASDISADVRGQLSDQIQSAIRSGMRRALEKSYQDARIAENQAQARDRLRIAKAMERREQRTRQIIDRFNALVDEGRFDEAEEAAFEAEKEDPTNIAAQTAIYSARFGGRVQFNERVRDLAERGFWKSMSLIEEAKIPFPDEPPLIYPDPERWEELTIRRKKYASIDLAKPGGAEEAIFKELERYAEVDYIDTPLTEVIEDIKTRHNNINIILDSGALELAGIDPEETITKTLSGIKLRNALRLMLKDLELTYVVQDEVLSITTLEQAEQQLITKVYPVGDLVLPIINIGGFGGGVGGGGLGGALNGGGLGGGGGGFGGGGGGFGGGGLGGGGFGGGGGFFDVDDPISLGSKSESKTATQTAPTAIPAAAPQKTRGKAITLDLENTTANVAWQQFFARQSKLPQEDQISESDIKATVARRMNSGQFKETVSLMNAALAHGFAKPWMYEAIGLAMEAAGEPKDEIERALMSAIDLTGDMDEVYYIATYMARIGLEKRAFSLMQQVAEANPTRAEPYGFALKLAKRLDDPAALKWACVGVLQNAWPDSERAVAEDAFRTAKATYAELMNQEADDNNRIAAELRAGVNHALIRDCVVQVSWTGDADIDVLVQEPSGSVCSIQNQRTTAGGVLLGDNSTITREGETGSSEPVAETYVCSKGFSGTYKVLIRPVWGEVAAGKVNVEVHTNYGTKGEQVISRSVKLGDEPSMVVFNLEHGRRTEPIEEHIIRNTAQKQIEVGRSILAQQLDSGSSSALQDLAFDRAIGNRLLPRRLRGGVGFRPVITTLPNGTNMSITSAVISADRRYVRISPAPTFSGVTEIATFNFVTGDGTNQANQGGGGLGGGGIGGGGGGLGGGGLGGGGLGGGGLGGGGGGLGGGGIF